MPASELSWVMLRRTNESVVVASEMPRPVAPRACSPEPLTLLSSIVMCADWVTLMPWPVVSTTVKPRIVTKLLELIRNPFTPPRTVTVAPGASAKVIGSAAVPELSTVTCSA